MNDWRQFGAAGTRALAEGRAADAAAHFRQVLALRPGDPDTLFNLAYALRLARRYTEAVDAYSDAMESGVAGPEEALVNRALILSEYLDRPDEAEVDLRRATEIAPRFFAAWFNLGMLYEDCGDAEAANSAYRSALEARPSAGRAWGRLAAIKTHREDAAGAIVMLERALAESSAQGEDRAEMEFALGNALEAAGFYPKAFAAIRRANARMAALRPPPARYDPSAHERLIDRLIAAYPRRPARPASDDETRPIFVCGMFRSGSTVGEQLLARHPEIVAGGEFETIPALVRERLQPYPESATSLGEQAIAALRAEYLGELDRRFAGAAHVTDKRPDNFLHLGLIKTLFPGARIVHTVRDPRDIALSTWFLNFAEGVSYSERLEDIAHYLGQYRRVMDHWRALFGADIVELDYDRLVRDGEATLGNCFVALGLDPRLARGAIGAGTAIRTPSNWQARAPLHSRSSGRWRHYRRELENVLPLL